MSTFQERPPADATPPPFVAPIGACDCHFHLVAVDKRYPFSPNQEYDPIAATLPAFRRVQKTLGIERGVLVHAACYGTDNRFLADTLHKNEGLRGVAIVNKEVTKATLRDLDKAGVRAIRIFARSADGASIADLEDLAERIAPLGWHVEISASGKLLPELAPRIKKLPVVAVLNHMARMDPATELGSPEIRALAGLLETGRVWVKLSAPYRMSKDEAPYHDMLALGRWLVQKAPERMLWATDWPNLHFAGTMPDAGMLLSLLSLWAPVPGVRDMILKDNAAQLYRFEPA